MVSDFTLDNYCEIIMGQSPTGETCNKIGIGTPLLNGPSEFGETHPIPVQFTSDVKKKSNLGDLLFCVRGSTGRMNWADQEYAIGRGLAAIRAINNYPIVFVRAIIETKLSELLLKATGSVFSNVNKEMIASISVRNITVNEAKSIASILKSLEDQILLLRQTNSTLEAIAQTLFKSWFVDFDPVHAKQEGKKPEGIDEATAALFPDSFEETELGMVPSRWQFSTLSSVADFQNGYAFKGSDWVEQGHPVIKIGNVKPLLIDFDGCSYVSPETVSILDRFKLGRGDLLVGMTGYVGETGLVTRTEVASYLNQRVGRIVTSKGLDDLGFVFAAVRQEKFKAYAESQSHGSAQANVSGADLMKFSVVIPSAQVLDTFNQATGKLIEKIIGNYEEAKNLANLRDTLLPRLISGQLRIADAEAEIEKVST